MIDRAELESLSRQLIDKGLLIEAGFVSLRLCVISPDAPQDQLNEMRLAFFAGAQHVFASVLTILEDGDEATDADLRRMDSVNAELQKFADEFQLRVARVKGNA